MPETRLQKAWPNVALNSREMPRLNRRNSEYCHGRQDGFHCKDELMGHAPGRHDFDIFTPTLRSPRDRILRRLNENLGIEVYASYDRVEVLPRTAEALANGAWRWSVLSPSGTELYVGSQYPISVLLHAVRISFEPAAIDRGLRELSIHPHAPVKTPKGRQISYDGLTRWEGIHDWNHRVSTLREDESHVR